MDILKAREELKLGKTIYDMTLRVVDYGRVSTDKNDQINSLENQKNYFNDMIDNVKSWIHVASYSDEGISGTQVYKREQFLQMIEDARLGKFDLILTKEVSRFARNTIDSISYTQLLLKYGVIVCFISDNLNTIYPDSEFRLTLMASMAQDEVRKLSERVKFGVKRSIKDGKVGGGGIYGYIKKDCKLTIDEKESIAVKMIYSWYSTGEYGLKKIGDMLAERGYYTRKGKVFSDITLKKMISNPRYKGYYTANLTEVEDYKTHKKIAKPKEEWIIYKDKSGRVPAIVEEALWNKANAVLKQRHDVWNSNVVNKELYLENKTYTSKLFCTEHNATFIRSANGKRAKKPVWQCNEYLRHGIKGCKTPIINEKHLDEIFTNVIERFVDTKEHFINKIVKDYMNIIKESCHQVVIDELKEKLSEKESQKEKLLDLSLSGIINDADFKSKNEKIIKEIQHIENELNIAEMSSHTLPYYATLSKQIKDNIRLQLDIRKNIGDYFNLFIDKVFISKINHDRKHIKLQIIFNFNHSYEEIEMVLNNNIKSKADGSNNKNLINVIV